nr:NB-ARC domain-containing protein [Micromonospora sp. DSM 115978]
REDRAAAGLDGSGGLGPGQALGDGRFGTGGARRRPWMVPGRTGDRLVARPDLAARTLAALTRPGPGERRVVLTGAGGFGKTTLAAEVCRDPKIEQRFPGGLLWVTLGESPSGAHLAEKVNDLSEALSGSRPAVSDPEQAGFRLGELLGDEPCLLVVDDVWRHAQLRPFLQGGPGCVRLVTTRRRDLFGSSVTSVDVPAMAGAEARALLGR